MLCLYYQLYLLSTHVTKNNITLIPETIRYHFSSLKDWLDINISRQYSIQVREHLYQINAWSSRQVLYKALFTWQHDSTTKMNHAQLGLQSLSICHVVMLQSWLIARLQEVINQSSCSCALSKHLASVWNSILWNKLINHLDFTIWS